MLPLAASLNSYCHVVADTFVTLAYFPSGIMIKWFHDLLYGDEERPGSGEGSIRGGVYSLLGARNGKHQRAQRVLCYSQSDRDLQS